METFTRFLVAAFFAVPSILFAQLPTVTFTATPTPICACGIVSFPNTTTNFPTQWRWYFPGGSPSTYITNTPPGNPPPIRYCTPGSYPVTCVVSNGFGQDSVTVNHCVVVDTIPVVTISGDGNVCQGMSTTLTLTASGGSHYMWSTGATTSSISINIIGIISLTYTVQVSDGACFKDTTLAIIVDTPPHNFFIGDTSICVGDSVTIFASTTARLKTQGYQYTYLWSTGSTADSITVKGITPGYYNYYLTVTHGACSLDSAEIRVHVHTCTGIENYADPLGMEVFPNPTSKQLSVILDNPIDKAAMITITDVTGRQVESETIGPNQSQLKIDVSPLSPGIYFLKLQTDQGIVVKKFVKE